MKNGLSKFLREIFFGMLYKAQDMDEQFLAIQGYSEHDILEREWLCYSALIDSYSGYSFQEW